MDDLEDYKARVEGFLNDSQASRVSAERRRDYVNNQQWTPEEVATLRARKQRPAVQNRLAPKVDGLKGLLIQRKTDPKAFPRTQAHEDSAQAATDALRYVADNVNFDDKKLDVADDFFVEGVGGVIVPVRDKKGEPEIEIRRIPWDRIYYDPHSREYDFSDAKYMGIITWMDLPDAQEKWKGKIDESSIGAYGDSFDDRPKWSEGNSKRRRVMVAEEFCKKDGVWMRSVFTENTFLEDPHPSPFEDEDGEPTNPIELVACCMDRDNNRFGVVEFWMDAQESINHHLSKFQHLSTTRQLLIRNGAFGDRIDELKNEFKKPDGIIDYDGEKGDLEIVDTSAMANAQLAMMEINSAHIDSVGFNAQLSGERQGNLSGKAIDLLTNAGTNELSSAFARLTSWEKRVYRQVWMRVRQFWTKEKWIRVTDEERNLRWVGFNYQITLQEQLEETINNKALPEPQRKAAAQMFMELGGGQENPDPQLQIPVEGRNNIAELDMDIILDQALDTLNIQQEQFTTMATLAADRPEIPFTALLRLSTLREKDELIKKIEDREENANELIQQTNQQEIEKAAELAKIDAAVNTQKIEDETKKALLTQKQQIEAKQQMLMFELEEKQQLLALELQAKVRMAQMEAQAKQQMAQMELASKQQLAQIDQAQVEHAAIHSPQAIESRANEQIAQSNIMLAQAKENEAQALSAVLDELKRPLVIQRDEQGRAAAVVAQ